MVSDNPVLCPSAPGDWEGSQVFGVITGTAENPQMVYLSSPAPVTEEVLSMAGPVNPDEIFRFAAPCANTACVHFVAEQSKCRFAEKVVRFASEVVDQLPACPIRATCRWWHQEGKQACLRCPQMVTNDLKPTEGMRLAANPEVI